MISVHCLLSENPFSFKLSSSTSPKLASSNTSSAEAVASSEKGLTSSPSDLCSGLLGADVLREIFVLFLAK